MTIETIDFGRLYREHLASVSRTITAASEWDARAAKMGSGLPHDTYANRFIARMDLADASTLLDVGCGPGTICLRLADRLTHVVGLDFSQAMLDRLTESATTRGLSNVATVRLSWEDDWSAVPECDIVVASRSTLVADMADALAKLNAKARRRVYLTHLVGGHFIDPAVIEAIGRKPAPMPDYIYVVNILHCMGIRPRLDYIEQEGHLANSASFEEFAGRVSWSLGELDAAEQSRLREWYDRTPPDSRAMAPKRWAFISWERDQR